MSPLAAFQSVRTIRPPAGVSPVAGAIAPAVTRTVGTSDTCGAALTDATPTDRAAGPEGEAGPAGAPTTRARPTARTSSGSLTRTEPGLMVTPISRNDAMPNARLVADVAVTASIAYCGE